MAKPFSKLTDGRKTYLRALRRWKVLSLADSVFSLFFPFNCGHDTGSFFPYSSESQRRISFFFLRALLLGLHLTFARMQENLKLWNQDTFSIQISSVILCDSVTFDPSKLKPPNFPGWHILWSLKFWHDIFDCLATLAKQRKLSSPLLNKVHVSFFF